MQQNLKKFINHKRQICKKLVDATEFKKIHGSRQICKKFVDQ